MTTPLGFPEPADTEMLADCAKRDRTLAQAVDAYLQAFNASMELTEGDVTFGAGWSHLNGTERTTATKYGPVVMLNIAASKSSASASNELICTLPVGFRPASTKRGLANNANSPRGVTIHPDGRITNDVGQSSGALAALVGSTAFPVY